MPPVNNQLGFQNFLSGKLTADLTAVATDVFIDTVPSVSEGFLVIDPFTPGSREVIFFTSKTSTKVSVPATGGRGVDGTSATTHFNGTSYIMATTSGILQALQNGSASTDPLRTAIFFDFIANNSGVIAQSAGLIGTFANITFWQSGVQYIGNSIANKTYTASKDTYVDILGNTDGTNTVTYTEVANNAASPALAGGYTRVAIVTTSGAAITNVNQGQETQVIPIISSVALSVTDSLGNLICPRDPSRKLLGYRQIVANSSGGTSVSDVAGLSVPIIAPAGRKVKVKLMAGLITGNSTSGVVQATITDGSNNVFQTANFQDYGFNGGGPGTLELVQTPAASSMTYKVRASIGPAGSVWTFVGAVNSPTYVKVELE